jgi:tetrahydromethanopterin S-methyltransferase subunit F
LSTEAIVGISLGSVFAIVLIVAIIYLLLKKKAG